MKRLLKICAYALVAVVLLVGGAAVVLPMVVDPNDYRAEIAAKVEQDTGRKLNIGGELRMTLLPWLGVKTGQISMGNAPGFGDETFASLESAQVRVKLLPLLSREVEMDTVVVNGLTLNLKRNAQGQANWDDLAGDAGRASGEAAPPKALAAFALGGVVLEDATIRFADAAADSVTELKNLVARTGEITLTRPIEAKLEFGFTHAQKGELMQGTVRGSTSVSVQPGERRLSLGKLDVAVTANAPAIATGTVSGALQGDLNYDDQRKQLNGQDLRLTLDAPSPNAAGLGPLKLSARGDLDLRLAENTLAIPKLSFSTPSLSRQDMSASVEATSTVVMNLESRRLALKDFKATGSVTNGPAGGAATAYELGGDITVDAAAESADLSGMRIRFGALSASGEVAARKLLSAPAVSGAIDTAPFDARALLQSAGISLGPMRDASALTKASVKTRFELAGGAVVLDPLRLTVDGATLSGKLSSPNIARQALRFDLHADRLNVDNYLPPGEAAAPPAAAGAIPVQWLRGLDVDGKLQVDELRYSDLDLAKVQLGVTAQNQRLTLSPLSARLAGGSYAGNISVDASTPQPVIRIDEKLSGMDLDAVLRALKVPTGRIDLRGGRSNIALKATLTTSADGKQLSARGVNLDASLGGKSLPGRSLPLRFAGDLEVDLASSRVRVSSMTASVSDLEARGNVDVANFDTAPSYSAKLSVAPFNLRALAGRFGLPVPSTGSSKAFTMVAFDGTVKGDGNGIDAQPMTLKLDRSTMTGSARVDNFLAPAIAFALDVDRLDADDYLPPKAKGKAATPGAVATVLPLDLVRSLNLNGTLKVKSLNVSGIKLSGVTVTAKAAGGQLKLSPLGASLYGGRYDGNVAMDAREAQARIALDETIAGVQVGELLKDFRGDAPVTGVTDLRAVLTASGRDTNALVRTLNGDVSFKVRDGTLQKIDVVNSMCGALASIDFDHLNKKTLAAGLANLLLSSTLKSKTGAQASASDGSTQFSTLQGSARITNGVARNDDLNLASPIVRVTGTGTVNLPDDSIDYQANAELVQACAGIGKRDLAGQLIPVRVTGSLSDPKVSPTLPVGLIQALASKRQSEQPAAAVPAPAPTTSAPVPAQQAQPELPKKPGHVVKEARDQLLKGILGNILK